MPGGKYDSSLTRVAPVFERLKAQSGEWPRRLLELPEFGSAGSVSTGDMDLTFIEGWWGKAERGLRPPVSLLSWLVRHPETWAASPERDERRRLLSGDPATVDLALESLRRSEADRDWFIFEGRTYPDALIQTPDAIIVVEGKRTESGPTTHTKWMAGRHQIWRHIDAAWEIRGQRDVFGIFIVEGENSGVPKKWRQAAQDALDEPALLGSFPHRSSVEVAELRRCFLGVCTWRQVCECFSIDLREMPDTVSGLNDRVHR